MTLFKYGLKIIIPLLLIGGGALLSCFCINNYDLQNKIEVDELVLYQVDSEHSCRALLKTFENNITILSYLFIGFGRKSEYSKTQFEPFFKPYVFLKRKVDIFSKAICFFFNVERRKSGNLVGFLVFDRKCNFNENVLENKCRSTRITKKGGGL